MGGNMKTTSSVLLVIGFMLCCGIGSASAVKKGVLQVTAGSTAFSCVCGESCGCGTIGKSRGKCQCGHDLVEVIITKVENNNAIFTYDGKTHRVPLTGKYSCACESSKGCCEIISQQPVTCGCGKEMKAVM
jgi:hypothetical protein